MGDTFAIISAFAAVASAASSVVQGSQANAAAKLEAQQYQQNAADAKLAADQAEAQKRRALGRTLAAQDALRSGRGLDLYSPTGNAIRSDTTSQAEQDITTTRYSDLAAAQRYDLAAAQSSAKGSAAMIGGIGGAATSILSGAKAFFPPHGIPAASSKTMAP